jgi:hypothetical protein
MGIELKRDMILEFLDVTLEKDLIKVLKSSVEN